MDLLGNTGEERGKHSPPAERVRPLSFDGFHGQVELAGEGLPLRRLIEGDEYPHDYIDQAVSQEYLPDGIAGTVYYGPGNAGFEREIGNRMTWWEKLRREGRERRNDDA